MKVQFDAHVHVHPGYDVSRVCENARAIGSPLILCLVETSTGGEFARVRNHRAASTTGELGSLRLDGDDPLFLIYGRQLVSSDRLEVLALALDPTHALAGTSDGEHSTGELVDRVLDSGALAVLPWGVGKWLGERGRIVHALAASPRRWQHPRFFLGDIAARARLVPAPLPFREPVRVLVGSDPLDLSGGEAQVAVYRNEVEMPLDVDRPAASLIAALEAGAPIARRGQVLGAGRAARDQVRLAAGRRHGTRPGPDPAPPTIDTDIAVIGAGIHGAAAAYEAVRRGYSVTLVDRDDLGCATSSNSLKILHGGLRYLQHGNVRRSRESIRERRRWLRLAPFLIRPLPCRLEASGPKRWMLRAGLAANDVLSIDRNRDVVTSRRLPRSTHDTWHDAIVLDTERLLLALVHSASSLAGTAFQVRTRDAAVVEPDGDGFMVRLQSGFTFRAGRVIRCVGAPASRRAGLSMNLLLDLPPLDEFVALALPHPHDGRNVFAVPWRGRAMVGTFDRDYPYEPAEPLRMDPEWVDEALAWMAPSHPALGGLTRDAVRFVHAGLLPVTDDGSALRDDAAVTESAPGLIDVVGVKYTTAYGVADRAVDLAARSTPSRTERAASDTQLLDVRPRIAAFVRDVANGDEPLGGGGPARGEVLFALRHEWAQTLEDVLLRRTGTASAGHPGREVVEKVADVLAEECGWTEGERVAAVAAFDANFHFAGNTR